MTTGHDDNGGTMGDDWGRTPPAYAVGLSSKRYPTVITPHYHHPLVIASGVERQLLSDPF